MTDVKDAIVFKAKTDLHLHLGREVGYNTFHSLYLLTNLADKTLELTVVNNSDETRFDLTPKDIEELIKHLEYKYEDLTGKEFPRVQKGDGISPFIPIVK